ncbi:MAG: phosphatidylglycerophosphatase A [Candidatus Paracaedibacteraceae bacterium]|jgi:phosphatidylglycerophosphatase A|nr:phosphatidylglycerophosphatase A [Candidatus Paracaedibacteraceae bacterium]
MIRFLASGFYSGYLPKAPGTWGTLVALPLILLCYYGHINLLFMTGVIFLVGWYVSQQLTQDPASDPDPSYIVIDEIAGMFLTVYLLLHFNIIDRLSEKGLAISFILFRLFDIWKPWPIGVIDIKLSKIVALRGFGVMIDDILAAIWAAITMAIFTKIMLYMS